MGEDLKKRSKFKKKRFFILLGILLIFAVTALVFLTELNKPVSSVVTSSQKTISNPLIYSIDLTPVLQNGQYASFNRPKGMNLTSTELTNSKNSLESYTYYVKDVYSWVLAIDISTSTTGLNGSSSYLIRLNDPSVYSESTEAINSQNITIFTDTSFPNGFSKVAFFSNGSKVATVSLIGNDSSGTGPLSKTFNMVIDSWLWH